MSKYGYVGKESDIPQQAFKSNAGVLSVNDHLGLSQENKLTQYGQLELIETQTASAATAIDFTTIKENEYDTHFMTIALTDISASAYMGVRFFEEGVIETASVYDDVAMTNNSEVKSTSRDRIIISQSNYINTAMGINVYFFNLRNNSRYSFVAFNGVGQKFPSADINYYNGAGTMHQTSIVDGIRLLPQSGNFTGDISLYGIREYR